ncbi:MAG: pyruvate ferredoxin oxidoreductase [Desulfobacterota bacterium]|nr:pyruvate ferredoxin oxidoreductase [Thermodesulfobacteriota bacterium]MDW8001954.1 pyruvate ferredoxin oxidoreductase [Deltaproteobacteria bacterium]
MVELLSGNHAIAEAVRLCKVDFIAAYPITPQTPIYEKIAEMVSDGRIKGQMMRAESEHSAMAACISASLTGVRVFTASSSQGIAFMHEMLHFASGNRVSIVMACVNRVVSAPWAFGSDQTDTLSQRDTGWIQLYCEDGQEALDTVIMAYRVAETVFLPVMVTIDGFYTSHFIEPVDIPDEKAVDKYLPPKSLPNRFDLKNPAFIQNVVDSHYYSEFKKRQFDDTMKAKETIIEADKEFGKLFGRSYGVVEADDLEDADVGIVTSGALVSCARIAKKNLREKGIKVGLLKIKLFRPFPYDEVIKHLANLKKVLVIDRNVSCGKGGIFCDELKGAMYNLEKRPKIYGFIGGLCGEDLPPETIEKIALYVINEDKAPEKPIWIHGMTF